MKVQTEQENFWMGEFGNEYIERNKSDVGKRINLFSNILSRTENITSVIELGSNIGLNLVAINQLLPTVKLSAIEINKKAVIELENLTFLNEIFNESILNFNPENKYDLSFTNGVLIHINPEKLGKTYEVLYQSSKKYILITEYYNPEPVEISYRGHEGKLFKRDFAGEFLDKYPDCKLVDYGFVYRRDPVFPLGDLTWFLMKKES